MNIPFENFKVEVNSLQLQIKTELAKRETPNRQLIEDGIINLQEYYNSPLRILWVLKEPYCDGVGSSRVDLQACKLEYSIVSPK